MKILIVDDEEIQRRKLARLISESSISFSDILCAPDVPGAIEIIESQHPSIVLSDIRMPVKDGLELTQYIQEKFGMHYTQDESYYMLDAAEDATVYLGVKEGIEPEEMIDALNEAQESGCFDAEKYVGRYPVKKHDHLLIPAGTIHCSGTNGMVLEISATPYIFTFKLWDWGRLGLDGRPRPINIKHGQEVIQWNRTESWVRKEIFNRIEPVAEGEGWREERTGLHENEFIETRRHWFTAPVLHRTDGSVNVLNLVEGREAIVESPTGGFEPFVVHYAETFIVPESVKEYTIRPYGESAGKQCATIKAFVKHNP
mgnify:CR=1 FL=1